MSTHTETIGFIGLGAMGRGMAANCVKKGFKLVVLDINPVPVATLVKLGAKAATSIADIAQAMFDRHHRTSLRQRSRRSHHGRRRPLRPA